ncbi:hypothetical protein INR49_019761 [Caranx melampygus]|nr:hypothetical protein INR49_019761 [Caranx melampygus]
MGKLYGWLKGLLIFFNVLLIILGCLLIAAVVKATSLNSQMAGLGVSGLGWLWAFIVGIIGISCLGICAGCSEKPLVLKIFAGFIGAGMVIVLICGIIIHCCGVSGPREWGSKIPDSCECHKNGITPFGVRDTCMSRPAGTTGPSQIYAQNCSDGIFSWVDFCYKIAIGFFFTCAATAVSSALIFLLLLLYVTTF